MSDSLLDAILARDSNAVAACLSADPERVHGPVPDEVAEKRIAGLTPLHLAVESGDVVIVRLLLDAGADFRARNDQGRTPLHDAVESGHGEIIALLRFRGAELDVALAAILGEGERLRELLRENGTRVDDRSTELSPLGWASFGNQVDTARILLEAGARMDDGELLCAASVGHVEVGRLLIEHGADPNAIDPCAGGTALHAAASMRYTDDSSRFVEMLLEHGADPEIRTTSGKTAAEIAEAGLERERDAPSECPRRFDRVLAVLERFGS